MKTWKKVKTVKLTDEQADILRAVKNIRKIERCSGIGIYRSRISRVAGYHDFQTTRILQQLKRKGLIKFDSWAMSWELVGETK